MRQLLPTADSTDDDGVREVDVHAFYARDWIDGLLHVRSDFVSSIDGAATAKGRSEGLQTSGDNVVFQALRDLSDLVLVGARTATLEAYAPIELDAERVTIRERFGLGPDLPTAVISRTLTVDPDAALYAKSGDGNRTIVLTCAASDARMRERLAEHCTVLVHGQDDIDLRSALAELATCGYGKVLFEGGPSIQAQLLDAGLVDELCLSITPKIIGPGAPRIVDGQAWPEPRRDARLTGLLEDAGALFARYDLR